MHTPSTIRTTFAGVACLALLSITSSSACSKKDDAATAPGSSAPIATDKLVSPLSGTFEGTILVHVDGKGSETGPFDILCSVKNDALRLDFPKKLLDVEKRIGNKAWAVFRAGDKKGFFAMEPAKIAYTIDFDAASEDIKHAVPLPGPPGMAAPNTKATVKRTGKKDVVASIACEEWEVVEADKRAVLCMAEESAGWLKFPTKALPDELALAAEVLDGKHFPLRAIGFAKGEESGRVEIKKIEKKPVPDADFQLPPGFKATDVMELFKSLGGAARPGAEGPPGAGMPVSKPKPKK